MAGGDITINATNAGNLLSDWFSKKTANLVPEISFLYQMAPFQKFEAVSGNAYVPVYDAWPQGWTLMAPGSNQDMNPSVSPEFPRAIVPIPAIGMTQAITYEQLKRMQNDPVYTFNEIIPKMNMLKLSHTSLYEAFDLYGQDANGFGDISAVGANTIDITAANYAKGLYVDRGNGYFDIYRAGVWTGQTIQVYGPDNSTPNRLIVSPADTGKVLVGDILRPQAAGQYLTKEFKGIIPILNEQTSLFSVDLTQYPLMKGSRLNNAGNPLTFENLLAAMLKTGFYCSYSEESDATVLLSPLSFGDIVKEVEVVRTFGGNQYNTKRIQRGAMEGVQIYGPNGVFTMICHPKIKAQHCVGLRMNSWISPGVTDIHLVNYGTTQDTFGPLYHIPRSLRFEYMTYSQRAIFCTQPAKNFLIYNITPSATFQAAA